MTLNDWLGAVFGVVLVGLAGPLLRRNVYEWLSAVLRVGGVLVILWAFRNAKGGTP